MRTTRDNARIVLGKPYAPTMGQRPAVLPLGILTRTRRGVTTVNVYRPGAAAFGAIGTSVKGA